MQGEGMGISEEITVTVVKANANLLGIEIVLGLFALAFLGFLYFKLRHKNTEIKPYKFSGTSYFCVANTEYKLGGKEK